MSPETRTKLTYFILGTAYFAGGVENGVSVPRGWLHWHQRDQAPDHVVGLVVAAYSVATLFTAPLMGRWVDRPGRSKGMLIAGVCLHIIGAVLEFLFTQHWVNIVARFLSGLGGGIDAVVLSETSRYTSLTQRTSAMALLVGSRLLGYMIVPGLDAVLWTEVLQYKQLPDRRTAASGMSLMILWGLVLLLTIFFYTELCRLKPLSLHFCSSTIPSPPKHSRHQSNAHFAGTVRSGLGDSYEIVENGASYSSSQPVSIPASLTSSQCSEIASEQLLGRSSEMIEEAEKFIQKMAEQSCSSANARKPFRMDYGSSKNCERQLSSELSEETSGQMSTSFNYNAEQGNSLVSRQGTDVDGGVSLTLSSGTFDQGSYIQRQGMLPHSLQEQESVFYILYQEIIHDDIVALLAILMSGTFSHLCFQMLITPVTQWSLKGEDINIITVFCAALVLIVVVCMLVWWFNPQQRAVHVAVVGACVLIVGNVVFMVFLSHMNTAEERYWNILLVSVSVGLYVVGLLLLLICATSIFTSIPSPQNHGLVQGVYHSALSVSAILAPLWIEGTLNQPYLHHGIIIGLLVLTLMLVLCSCKRLASRFHSMRRTAVKRRSAQNIPTAPRQNPEEQPLL